MVGLVSGVGSLIIVGLAFYALDSIIKRLPPKFEEVSRPFPQVDFGVWAHLESFWLENFRVAWSNGEWEIGPECSLVAVGEVKVGDKTSEDHRVSFNLRGVSTAYQKSDQIGWAEVREKSATVNLWLAPQTVAAMLQELRQHEKMHVHCHGWVEQERAKITYFELTPQ